MILIVKKTFAGCCYPFYPQLTTGHEVHKASGACLQNNLLNYDIDQMSIDMPNIFNSNTRIRCMRVIGDYNLNYFVI